MNEKKVQNQNQVCSQKWYSFNQNKSMRKNFKIKMTITFPKMVLFRSSQSHLSKEIKNWLPLECGVPAFAHATIPLWLNLRREWNSSGKTLPYMLSPPAHINKPRYALNITRNCYTCSNLLPDHTSGLWINSNLENQY